MEAVLEGKLRILTSGSAKSKVNEDIHQLDNQLRDIDIHNTDNLSKYLETLKMYTEGIHGTCGVSIKTMEDISYNAIYIDEGQDFQYKCDELLHTLIIKDKEDVIGNTGCLGT